jgi:hypothetical protein
LDVDINPAKSHGTFRSSSSPEIRIWYLVTAESVPVQSLSELL